MPNAEKAEADLADLRAGIEMLADEWDHREYVRMPEDFAASLRALLTDRSGT